MSALRALVLLGVLVTTAARGSAQEAPSYSKQVQPFLTKYCVDCHSGNRPKGSLNLENYQAVMRGRKGRQVVVPGAPDQSRLVLTTEGKARPPMPPRKSRQPTAAESAVLRAWVAAGAKDDAAAPAVKQGRFAPGSGPAPALENIGPLAGEVCCFDPEPPPPVEHPRAVPPALK